MAGDARPSPKKVQKRHQLLRHRPDAACPRAPVCSGRRRACTLTFEACERSHDGAAEAREGRASWAMSKLMPSPWGKGCGKRETAMFTRCVKSL